MQLSITPIASPECRLPFVNSPHLFLNGHRCLAAMNISDEGRDSRIFLINVDTLKSESFAVPDGQWGPYGFAEGTDGKLYVGFFYGRIYAFDLATKEFECKADPFANTSVKRLTWGGFASRRGRVYMGVYPTGEFTEYNIASGSFHTIAPLEGTPFGTYAKQFAELPDGRMMVMLYGAHGEILIYNPIRRQIEARREITCHTGQSKHRSLNLLDENRVLYAADGAIKVFNFQSMDWEEDFLSKTTEQLAWIGCIQDTFYGVESETGQVYEIRRSGFKPIETGLKHGNRPGGGIHQIAPDLFACLGDNGQFVRFSPTKGHLDSVQVNNRTKNGMNINSLRKDPESNRAIGSHFITSQVFQTDLETGVSQSSLHKVVTIPGQITCSVFLDGVAYLGVYGKALILACRLDQPFLFGENPRLVCKIGYEQNRPMALFADKGLLYTVTRANYGKLGGAMSVIDPSTGTCEVYRDFVPTQNPVSLFKHGALLVGTTEIFGDQGSCQPKVDQAVIFSWDINQRRTQHTCAPWPGKSLRALGLSPNGTMVGFAAGQYFLYQVESQICTVHSWNETEPSSGVFLDASRFLAAIPSTEGKTRILILNVETHCVTRIGETESLRLFEVLDAEEVLACVKGSLIAKVKLHDH